MLREFLILCVFGCALAGCQTRAPDGSVRYHYFGYTVVTLPKSAPDRSDFAVRQVMNVGIAAGDGSLGLGFNKNRTVTLPAEGAIYLEVKTDAQFEAARRLLEIYEGLCITKGTTATVVESDPR